MKTIARAMSFMALIAAWPAAAQTWDNSGNKLVNGTYYFRYSTYTVGDSSGLINYAGALYGTITFDGNGNYVMNTPWLVDSSGNNQQETSVSGTYTIAASGYGFIANPFGDFIYGLVTNGVFVGSSTESGANDLFIAAIATPTATSATLKGTYSMAYFSVPDGDPGDNYDALAQFTADGRGNIGTVNFTAYTGLSGSSPIPVAEAGVHYVFSNGAGNISFPTASNEAVAGTQFLYISPDGNFIFGGSANFWDFFVGVRKGTATSLGGTSASGVCQPQCLYYQAGLSEDSSQLTATTGYAIIGSYYGSLLATGGDIIGHQRFEDVFGIGSEDDTYSDAYPISATGEYIDGTTQYDFSQDGGVRIGFGIGPFLGIDVSLRAPSFSGPGVWLDPTGVRNAASFSPFTAQVADGELMILLGTGLANGTVVTTASPFTKNLGGVQVLINDVLSPLYYVSSGAIAVVVPYGTGATTPIAKFQVFNNGTPSNVVYAFVGATAPGMLAQGSDGISDGIVQHLDFTMVTQANPAQEGETLLGYVTGLGDVSPAIADGAAGPSDPTSNATNAITMAVNGLAANVTFAGLVPTLSGLYAVVFTVPTGVGSGDALLTLGGPDAFSFEATLPVGGSNSSAVSSANSSAKSSAAKKGRARPLRREGARMHTSGLQQSPLARPSLFVTID
jgi:uncharacterized protein (TIGR03437 family)